MTSIFKKRTVMHVIRPYIYWELPGWGKLFNAFVGGYEADREWEGLTRTWIRGKYHGYEMSLDLGGWSNRATYFLGRFYDLPTQLVLFESLRPGDTLVDVGANEGMISLLGSRLVGTEGKVIAFEPNPKPRSIFQSTIERNSISNIKILPIGLAQSDQILLLKVPKINSGEASFASSNYSDNEVDIIECPVRVGDHLLTEENPRLVKIDVEGFELQVLKGLENTIARNLPGLLLEMSGQLARNAGASLAEISNFLLHRGYIPYQLAIRGRNKLRLVERPITEDLHADFLWQHPTHRMLDPDRFR